MDQITDNIYLGSLSSAEDQLALANANITHILSVTDEKVRFPEGLELTIKRLELGDYSHESVIPLFSETNQFIDDCIKNGGSILVHCTLGMSRSSTMVIAYLMKTQSQTFSEVLAIVRARRPIVKPNSGYKEQLEIYSQCGCNFTEDNPQFQQWKRKRDEILMITPFALGVAPASSERIKIRQVDGNSNMDMIFDGLWLGDRFAAQNGSALARAGITHILTMTTDSIAYPKNQQLEIKRVDIEDYPDEDMIALISSTNSFIATALDDGGRILVHCTQGVSRSATIVAAYVMKTQSHLSSASEAIAYLQSRRPVVRPNVGFMEQLEIYERAGCEVAENNKEYKEWQERRNREFEKKMKLWGV